MATTMTWETVCGDNYDPVDVAAPERRQGMRLDAMARLPADSLVGITITEDECREAERVIAAELARVSGR